MPVDWAQCQNQFVSERRAERPKDSEYGHLDERVCSNLERRWLVAGRAVVNVGCNYGKRSPRFKAASLDRRCSWVFHGHRVRHLRSGYGHSRNFRGGAAICAVVLCYEILLILRWSLRRTSA
jgi:hypothetical protein